MIQPELYERFLALHQRAQGFVMPNPWDATSALLLKEAGFEALGTSSAAIAAALGRIGRSPRNQPRRAYRQCAADRPDDWFAG